MKEINELYEEMLQVLEDHEFEKANLLAVEADVLLKNTKLTEDEKFYLYQKAEKISLKMEEKMDEIKELLIEQNKSDAISKKFENE